LLEHAAATAGAAGSAAVVAARAIAAITAAAAVAAVAARATAFVTVATGTAAATRAVAAGGPARRAAAATAGRLESIVVGSVEGRFEGDVHVDSGLVSMVLRYILNRSPSSPFAQLHAAAVTPPSRRR